MNTRNECHVRREEIAALVMGELDSAAAEELERHLQTCDSCRGFREALAGQEVELRSTFDAIARSVEWVEPLVERFDESPQPLVIKAFSPLRRLKKGFATMRRSHKILAAAAAVALTFTGLASWLVPGRSGGGLAFAQVMETLRVFRPYSCTYTFQSEGKPPLTYREMRLSLSQRRELRSDGTIVVVDMSSAPVKTLVLNPVKKTAVEETLTKMGPQTDPDILRIVVGMSDGAAEDLGVQVIDGRTAHGFHRPDPRNEFTVWADPETRLPIRIELDQPQIGRKIILSDFDFVTPLDESLFATTAPEGYTVQKQESAITAAGVSPAQMAKNATFKTYALAKAPGWTLEPQLIQVSDPASPGHHMYVTAARAKDGRHFVLAQSHTFNTALPAKIKTGKVIYTSANGFKVWSGGPEKWYSEILLKSTQDVIGGEVSEARVGFALESPAGTFPLMAVNGPVSDEELHSVVDSLIPTEEFKE